jgi:hypothetical protein
MHRSPLLKPLHVLAPPLPHNRDVIRVIAWCEWFGAEQETFMLVPPIIRRATVAALTA